MHKISPKLTAAIAPPLTAISSAAILTGSLDKTSLAALAGVVIGGLLGYQTPHTTGTPITADDPSTPLFNEKTGVFAASSPAGGVQVVNTWSPTATDGDTGDDGDDTLPAELGTHPIDVGIVPDAIDQPDPNHPEAS